MHNDDSSDVSEDDLPELSRRVKLAEHQSASVVFYAPSELAGSGGMHREIIRCNPSWYGQYPRFDTVLVTTNPDAWGMRRYRVARVRFFWSFRANTRTYSSAFVEWFVTDVDGPDNVTGLWIVRPEMIGDVRVTGIVPITSIARACHLMPVLGSALLPFQFHFSDTLDAFKKYYVNAYADYHSHETIL